MGARLPVPTTLRADQGRMTAAAAAIRATGGFQRAAAPRGGSALQAARGMKDEETERASADSPRSAPAAVTSPVAWRRAPRATSASAHSSSTTCRFSVRTRRDISTAGQYTA